MTRIPSRIKRLAVEKVAAKLPTTSSPTFPGACLHTLRNPVCQCASVMCFRYKKRDKTYARVPHEFTKKQSSQSARVTVTTTTHPHVHTRPITPFAPICPSLLFPTFFPFLSLSFLFSMFPPFPFSSLPAFPPLFPSFSRLFLPFFLPRPPLLLS